MVLLDEGASLVAQRRPRYDAPRGFSLEAWVMFWPPPLAKGEGSDRRGAWSDPRRQDRFAVVSRPGSWEMGLLGDGALYAVIGDADHPESSGTYAAATASGEVIGSRWTHLRVSFDGLELTLEVDGIAREWAPEDFEKVDPRDWPPLPETVPAGDHELMISHPNRFFFGAIDEVKVRVALEPKSYRLPVEVGFLDPSRLVRFDTRGSLDPIHHADAVLVRIGELGEDLVEEVGSPAGGTSVAPVEAAEEEALADESESEEAILGDPVGALARYLDEQIRAAKSGEGGLDGDPSLDPNRATPGEGEPDAGSRERGVKRIHRIIIDLTGTIRG